MNEKFFELKKEKQDRIINGVIKCFALCGYKRASTDEMVKEAKISKGLLFHYFLSKKGAYEFVYSYSARYVAMEYERSLRLKEDDFFEIQKDLERAKMEIMKQYPYMLIFLNNSFLEEDEEAVASVSATMDLVSGNLSKVYAKADLSRFRDDVNPSNILKMVIFTMDGLLKEQVSLKKIDLEKLYQDSMEYLEMYKNCFYK